MRRSTFTIGTLGIAAALLASGTAVAPAQSAASMATGAPGVLSHFDLARKDCVGTAQDRTSRVWYTVANGVLSDVYEPTIDTANIETMQFIVTDGETFTDTQSRDMTATVSADSTGMVCTVTSTAKTGRYRLTTTYLTDPKRNSVVVRTQLTALQADLTRCNSMYASIRLSAGTAVAAQASVRMRARIVRSLIRRPVHWSRTTPTRSRLP